MPPGRRVNSRMWEAPMRILAMDFSTSRRSVALCELRDGAAEVLQTYTFDGNSIAPLALLRRLEGFDPAGVEGIAVGLGPGSYTGIRSALSVAQGFNLARGTLAVGVSSCDAIALAAGHLGIKGELEVVIDAQRNEIYSARYELNGGGIRLARRLEIRGQPETGRVVGPDATRWNPNGVIVHPSAFAIGKLAAGLTFGPPEVWEPIYLREPSFAKAPAVRHA